MICKNVEPSLLWQHFAVLCAYPRPSHHEAALRAQIQAWAAQLGLSHELDAVGNLLIRKPATPGMENRLGVVLQGHLDMVALKNEAVVHDFLRDPIKTYIADGWMHAEGTTLGADNGIGVAAALAVLESQDLAHGPLEVLLTIDEESGMSGAKGLQPNCLQGQLLFNLDTEDWGELYVGCAGGIDVSVGQTLHPEPMPAGWVVRDLALTGLKGGHSGVDIHLERGNAIKLMSRMLFQAIPLFDLRLVSLRGGSLRNALPREAFARIAIPACDAANFSAFAAQCLAEWQQELQAVESDIALQVVDGQAEQVLSHADSAKVVNLLMGLPHGIRRWSNEVAGVVESSNNLGVVQFDGRRFDAVLMVRSLTETGVTELVQTIRAIARLGGFAVESSGAYPGWAPNLQSRALTVLQQTYQALYGAAPKVKVIHAGLECGLIGKAYPALDMVSFGPTIRGAHSPDERVEMASVTQFWALLTASLAAVPVAN
ncbi:aminoacyl-histidine dipeptidase [uncultured Deefgea sp.]|uniref:aminoacyl-histidine dipeptidase n=1 Tax=uncultured Deefgea sp. TaxID=1304914 RepID=UPI002598A1C1|nr:aminoacyl-histidine dipeptidase [uncultured Deefgea sp.]